MKKITLLLFILLAGFSTLSAQFEIKALVGINFPSLSNPPTNLTAAAKGGIQYGLGVLIGDKFYVEPGLQIVKNSKTITADPEEFVFTQNFVKVPVYAGYHLFGHESGPVALRIFAGPAVTVAGKISKGEDQISKEDIKNAHWLVDAGVGLDILFLFVELNYEYGLSKYWTDQTLNSSHKSFNLNAGIHIDF